MIDLHINVRQPPLITRRQVCTSINNRVGGSGVLTDIQSIRNQKQGFYTYTRGSFKAGRLSTVILIGTGISKSIEKFYLRD